MHWRTLISAEELAGQLANPELVVVDCRFDLRDPGAGERAYAAGHLPGAHYAHLDRDLSDLSRQGRGRHPLPEADAFCATLARWGVTANHQVVAYDANDGSVAARLWWMLRLLGHDRVAVLNGGLAAWCANAYALEAAAPRSRPGRYHARYDVRAMASTAVIAARMASGNSKLIDARAAERFRGEIEPIDAIAGHIPGAVNRPFVQNLGPDGRFKSPGVLAEEFKALLGDSPSNETLLMCGSGVTACHHLLAMEHAGLRGARVYPGSWSEWISDPARPVARD
ncbi:MAG: sulfurtransferase [Chiayiivirga sp.]|jgi:thiosulfate/3-mercaptopyruvate sulfurtransferase|uniref:sulfurtransferase n=1 Tax=Chiayiivirga sp. TaxID=2041042 RepID=UPI0025C40194|nr:sulfurtransferase [Chiayiivirga sp.]MCI1710327.1 sulfurtransferase [Chiayiivirga sp.]MCI1728893.1 sulfurtransferase [Chiayiivirga sp.]